MLDKGSCLCGACQFQIEAETGSVGKCHCSKCRKVSGTGSNAVFWLNPDQLRWIQGEKHIKTYTMPDGWGSVFCGNCGSPLPVVINESFCVAPAGLMDDKVVVDFRGHIWFEDKPSWDVIGDDAPQFFQGAG